MTVALAARRPVQGGRQVGSLSGLIAKDPGAYPLLYPELSLSLLGF